MNNKKSGAEKSLLTKTLRQFAACIAVCFALMAPLFYLLTKYFYAEDMIDIIEAIEHGHEIPPLDLEHDIIAGMMIQFLLIFIAVALALFITVRFVTKKLWQPFDDTLLKAEQFNLAKSDIPRFTETGIHEFSRLNDSLTQLMTKDKETYRIQKEFTENASHELQTPLAVIRGKLDLLMQQNLSESQMRLVADLYALTTRMGHLNRNLLLLAKIDNAQYTDMEDVDLSPLISDSLTLYDVLRDGVSLRLDDSNAHGGTKLRANPILLECMLKNLIVNAIRHTPAGGDINITLRHDSLTVSNKADDGKPLDTSVLFCRFHPGDTGNKGNGLGLAIVKAVCDFHRWNVGYSFTSGYHQFTVNFNGQ